MEESECNAIKQIHGGQQGRAVELAFPNSNGRGPRGQARPEGYILSTIALVIAYK